VRLARPPAGRTSEVGEDALRERTRGLSAETGLDAARRGRTDWSGDAGGAERRSSRVRARAGLWTTTLFVGGERVRAQQRLITEGERVGMAAVFCLPRAEDGHRVGEA